MNSSVWSTSYIFHKLETNFLLSFKSYTWDDHPTRPLLILVNGFIHDECKCHSYSFHSLTFHLQHKARLQLPRGIPNTIHPISQFKFKFPSVTRTSRRWIVPLLSTPAFALALGLDLCLCLSSNANANALFTECFVFVVVLGRPNSISSKSHTLASFEMNFGRIFMRAHFVRVWEGFVRSMLAWNARGGREGIVSMCIGPYRMMDDG